MNKNEVNLQDIQEESREQDTSRLVDMSYTEEELAEQERATDTEGLDEDGTSIRVFHNRYVKIGLTAAAVAFAAFHIWLVFIKWTNIFAILSSHWAVGMLFLFIYYPTKKGALGKQKRFNVFDVTCLVATAAIWAYIMKDSLGLMERLTYASYSTIDIVVGIAAIFLTLEATRRSMGLGLPIVVVFLVLYALFGAHLPGALANKSYSIPRITFNVFNLYGMFGTPIKMSCQNIFLLLLFGGFLQELGTGDTIMSMATSGFGGSRGGPAKVSVVSSACLGMISGSSVGNVVSTGVFTIPLMKKTGYKAEFAGAVEAVASTGGQIMPPVMGTAAFIMAELLGMPYAEICLAGLIPALVYYFGLLVAVDLEAGKLGLGRMDTSKLEKVSAILKKKWYHVIPVVTLIGCLAFKMTIPKASLLATASMVLAALIARDGTLTVESFINAMERGTKNAVTIIVCCACAGIAISVINLTGLGIKFTLVVTKIAGTSMLLSLIFSAIATIILGMGLPTSAAYIVVASVLVGALTKLGLAPLTAHMFLFYCASLAEITPPVAMAAYAAGNVAKAPPMKVGFTAVRLALVAFIMPFFIAYNPALILQSDVGTIIEAVITAFIGVYFMTVALEGWFEGKLHPVLRVVMFIAAVFTIHPQLLTDICGLTGIVVCCILHKPMRQWVVTKFKKKQKSAV